MKTRSAAADLGLASGLGDQLKEETADDLDERRKKAMKAAQPMGTNTAASALLGTYGASAAAY